MALGIIRNNFVTTNAVFNGSGADKPNAGYIDKIVISDSNWASGSLFVTLNDTKEVFSKTAISGTNPVVFYPRVYVHNTTGDAVSGTTGPFMDRIRFNGPLMFSGIGLGSVVNGNSGNIWVYFETEN